MVMGWNWKESDRMESFGSDIEDLDIPSGSLMRHRENNGVEAREEGGENILGYSDWGELDNHHLILAENIYLFP
jgi:hypothetical protein